MEATRRRALILVDSAQTPRQIYRLNSAKHLRSSCVYPPSYPTRRPGALVSLKQTIMDRNPFRTRMQDLYRVLYGENRPGTKRVLTQARFK